MNTGAARKKNVHRFLGWAMMLTVILAMVIYVGIYWNADVIAMIFNSGRDMDLQRIAVEGLKIYFTACPFVGGISCLRYTCGNRSGGSGTDDLIASRADRDRTAGIYHGKCGRAYRCVDDISADWQLVVCVVTCGLYKKMKRTYLK